MNDHAPDQMLCRLIAYTAQTLNVTPDQIVSSKRERELVLARSIIADIAYSDFLYNYCQTMKTPTDFRKWQLHIRKQCVNCQQPDHAETIRPWNLNWTLLGQILQAKNS